MSTKKYLVGLLAIVVAASYIMITLETGGARLKVNTANTNFYIFNGSWVLSATENMNLYNGSTKISKTSTTLGTQNISNEIVMVWRSTHFANGVLISQKYFFNSASSNVEDFPINETLEVKDATGLTIRHETTKLAYSGPNYVVTGTSVSFGRMKIEFPDNYSFGRMYSTGRLRIDYKIHSNYEQFEFRMYDPAAPTSTVLYLNGSSINRIIETGEPLNISATVNITGLQVCLSVNHTYLGENFTCGTTNVNYTWYPTSSTNKFNDSTTSKSLNYSTTANQTFYLRLHSYDRLNNATANLTGVNTSGDNYPSNVKVYINDTLSNSFPGQLREGAANSNTFNDSTTSKNLTFTGVGSQAVYISMPKNAIVTDAYLNLTGYQLSDYYQEMANSTSTTTNYFYINYSKPSYTSAVWQVKHGNLATYNITLPTNCFNQSLIQLRFYSRAWSGAQPSGTSYGQCFSGSTWDNITSTESGGYAQGFGGACNNEANMYDGNWNTQAGWSDISSCWWQVNNPLDATNGYSYSAIYEEGMFWNNSVYPSNPYLDVEGDGDMEWNWTTSSFNTTNTTGNFSDSLNHYLSVCTANSYGNCIIPLTVGSSTAGKIQLSAINITYNIYYNPITLNTSYLQNFLGNSNYGYQDIPVRIEANQGNVTVNNLNMSYNGTGVLNITASYAGNATYATSSDQQNLTVYYSNFTRAFPYSFMTEPIFLPLTNNSKNVSMYGQTSTKPGYNITGKGYDTGFNISIRINQSMDSCMNMTVGTSDTVYNFTVNTTRRQILSNITINQTAGLWLKLNMYNCNSSTVYRDWWVELKSCCYSCMACW